VAKPTFNPPPSWTALAATFSPPPGWQPTPDYPPVPPGWSLWLTGRDSAKERDRVEGWRRLWAATSAELAAERRVGDELRARLAEQDRRAAATRAEYDELQQRIKQSRRDLGRIDGEIIDASGILDIQEAGLYEYRHPLADAEAYKVELATLRYEMKQTVAKGQAISSGTTWQLGGSVREGKTLVTNITKLMLRAYNAEADAIVRAVRPYKLDEALGKLTAAATTTAKLGSTLQLEITPGYHRLRLREIELCADYQNKVADQKEADRAERERLREERKANEEITREHDRLQRELTHYQTALASLDTSGDPTSRQRLEDKLAEVQAAVEAIDARAANLRAGYVYVISNIGTMGSGMVKIGMTRRLEPMDRINELGDASVPFRFDVHALIFSDDAVTLETRLHQVFADRAVNLVNRRREFFYTTPGEVKTMLKRLNADLLHFTDVPDAPEWTQSESARQQRAMPGSLAPMSVRTG